MFNEIDKYVTTLIKNKTEKRQIINLKTEMGSLSQILKI